MKLSRRAKNPKRATPESETEREPAVGCSAWLDQRRIWRKALDNSTDYSIRAVLPPADDLYIKLAKMAEPSYRGIMPFLVETLKKKGIRFDERDFGDNEIVHLNEDIVILRGAALDLVNSALKGAEHGITGEKMRQGNLRFAKFTRTLRLCALRFIYACAKIVDKAHKGLTERS
jgi:hypothetical protein